VILDVNGVDHSVEDSEPWESLLFVLRERLGLYGTKNACEQGECGSCSVLVDDQVVCACLVPARAAEGRRVVTVEGLDGDDVATAVRDHVRTGGGVQCGFCTPGFVVTATAMLKRNPEATRQQIAEGLAGNLCRCTGYRKILEAVDQARDALAGGAPGHPEGSR
jgi:aerobic carbon-monoxide dehydrogenase small subunit